MFNHTPMYRWIWICRCSLADVLHWCEPKQNMRTCTTTTRGTGPERLEAMAESSWELPIRSTEMPPRAIANQKSSSAQCPHSHYCPTADLSGNRLVVEKLTDRLSESWQTCGSVVKFFWTAWNINCLKHSHSGSPQRLRSIDGDRWPRLPQFCLKFRFHYILDIYSIFI